MKNLRFSFSAVAGLGSRVILPFVISLLLLFSCGKSEEEKIKVAKDAFMDGCINASAPGVGPDFQKKYCPCAWQVIIGDGVFKEKLLSGEVGDNARQLLEERMQDSVFAKKLTRCAIESM